MLEFGVDMGYSHDSGSGGGRYGDLTCKSVREEASHVDGDGVGD